MENDKFSPLTVDESGKLHGGFAETGNGNSDNALYNNNCSLDATLINNNCGCKKCAVEEKPEPPKPTDPNTPTVEEG